MDIKTLKITLGRQGPNNILPDDTIQGTKTNTQYYVRRVAYDKISNIYWLDVETESLLDVTDTEYILVKESRFAPWYHEVCETCVTPESCDFCQKLVGWTTKKFAYIGDTIEFFNSQEVIEEISMDPVLIDRLTIATDRSTWLFLDDPEIKIIKRGPWLCYRSKINPDYISHCSVCLHPRCSECFYQELLKNQG